MTSWAKKHPLTKNKIKKENTRNDITKYKN